MSVTCIVVAAGDGVRLNVDGGIGRKASVPLAGLPMVVWSLRALAAVEETSVRGVLVVHADDLITAEQWLAAAALPRDRWSIEVGGPTRGESVRRGLAQVSEESEWVLVHDAARPLLTPEGISAVLAGAHATGAAILATPVVDSLKKSRRQGGDWVIDHAVPRDPLWHAQTPQVFRRKLLAQAHKGQPEATDDAELVTLLGGSVRLIESPTPNFKITIRADLSVAEALLGARNS